MSLPENLRFDKRLLDRNLREGVITKEQYDAHINALIDLEDKLEYIDLSEDDDINVSKVAPPAEPQA